MSELRVEILQAMPLFGGVRADTLAQLLEAAGARSVACKDYFFREGEAGECMFVLEHGCVAVLKHYQGEDYRLRELQAGECFGEMALVDLSPRSASVVALSDARALELTPELLYAIYERDPEQFTLLQMNLARELSRRLREADDRLLETCIANGSRAPW